MCSRQSGVLISNFLSVFSWEKYILLALAKSLTKICSALRRQKISECYNYNIVEQVLMFYHLKIRYCVSTIHL